MKKLQHCRLHVLDRHLLVDIRLYYRAAAHPSFSRCQRLGICAILTVDNSASARYVLDENYVVCCHSWGGTDAPTMRLTKTARI